MTVITNPPYPSYFDVDGAPLEDGYIYFGAANQNPETNPITVYWDAAYTQPALQPIRTSGGFTYRAGTPANIYVSTDFSITVRDKNRRLVYSKLLSEGQATAEVNLQYSTQSITATAGQTVFGLSTAYTPGNNSLAVYHNGSRLIVGSDYTETSATVITLAIGATAGDVLQFVTATPINPSSLGAAAVAYIPAGAGAVATNVQAKLRETVSVRDFGAVGDGVTDDTAAIQAAINYCEQTYSTAFNAIDSVVGSKTANWLTLRAPAGLYKLTSTLRIKAPINFIGDGETATKFIAGTGFTAISNNAIIDFSRSDGHWLLSQRISGFSVIDGSNAFVTVYGKYLHNYHIDDVAGVGGTYGLLLEGSYSGKIGRISLYSNTVAGRILGLYSPSTQEANDIHVERVEAYDNGTGLEVGGGLNIYIKGVIQKTNLECVKVVDNLQLLDVSGLYLEDWYNSLADYNLAAFAVTTPANGSGKIVGQLIATKMTAVDNKPVIQLDQVLNATITDNYWHNSTTCVNIATNTALKSIEYKRNYLKRSGGASNPGTSPQEFYGYILRNQSSTIFPELLASDFITGNNATNTGDANFIYGFSGQIANAKCGKLIVDTVVPFSLRYTSSMANLRVIQGLGPATGFTCAIRSYILDADLLEVSNLKISSSVNTADTAIGDTATTCYVGGTFNTSQRMVLREVTFENTDATGVNAVEFGRNLLRSTLQNCHMITNATNKGGVFSKNCAFINLTSNNDSTGTATTNVQTQGNAFINCPTVGASPSGTGNRVL